jgi:hypothetical protein
MKILFRAYFHQKHLQKKVGRKFIRVRIRTFLKVGPGSGQKSSGSATLVINLFVLPFMIITTSVAEPHHLYAAPAPIKNFGAALDPAAPAPARTLLYGYVKFLKRTKVLTHLETSFAEPHHFNAAQAPNENFDVAPAPAPTLLYSKKRILKRTKV